MVMIAGQSRDELLELHKWLLKMGPQGVIDRTSSYWRLWVGGTNINFGNLPPKVVELFKRSLLVLRTQIDNGGAIVAANDSDIMQFSRDTYSYMWPRDGRWWPTRWTWPASPTSRAGSTRSARDVLTEEGYFYHKYNPDGSPASSWHPWVLKGNRAMPIQEDETALVVWALWRHYFRYRDIEFIRPLWVDVVQKAADFMVRYRDPRTGLPLPSYDLWEERWGVHAFTVATVYGGLEGGAQLRRLLRRPRQGRDLQHGRRGSEGRRGQVSVQREAEPLRPPARVRSDNSQAARQRRLRGRRRRSAASRAPRNCSRSTR